MAKKLVIPILGNADDLEAAMLRAGLVAEDSSKKITGSFRSAGLAAAQAAKDMGASLDEQAAAAGRAAAAFTEMDATITRAQRSAGKAAATAAGQVGASVDEQRSAYLRAIAVQGDYEAAQKRSADAAKAAAAEQVRAAQEVAAATEKAHAAALKSFAAFGRKALLGGVGIVGASVYGGARLQSSMEQLQTQAGASSGQVNSMTNAVLSKAGGLATGPQALSESLYHAFSATHNMAESLNIMSTAAKEARISNASLTDTTTALTAAVFSAIPGAKNYAQAMGTLNATVGAGDMHFQDLNEAFAGPMLATVKGYGLSLKDVGAALATFGDLNIRGADAATQLRMAVQYMAKPASTAGPLLQKLGLNAGSFATAMQSGGLLPALQLLHDRLQAAGVQGNEMARVIGDLFTKRGAAGVTILENSIGKLESKYVAVGKGANQVNSGWAEWNKTLVAQFDHLEATVQALADKFGLYLVPKLEAVGKATQAVIGWFEKHKSAAEALAIVIGGVLGTAITVYAYTRAVAFVKGTEDMFVGVSKLASFLTGGMIPALERTGPGITSIGVKSSAAGAEVVSSDAEIEASNAAAGASFTAMGGEAAAGAAEVDAQMATLTAGVSSADTAIEADNVAAGASFTALLGPIGLVTAGVGLLAGAYLTAAHHAGTLITVNGRLMRNPHLALGAGSGPVAGSGGYTSPHGWNWGGSGIAGGGTHATGPGGLPWVPSKGSNWQRIAGALAAQGFSKVAIAGILGNFAQETGGGNLNAINTADTGSGASGMGGMGLANWTGGRRLAEMEYARKHGLGATSLNAQIGYLLQELRATSGPYAYHKAYNAISGASTPQQAAALFDQIFEGGTDPNGVREASARQAYVMMSGRGGHGISPSLAAYLNGTSKAATAAHTSTIPVAVATMLSTAQALIGTPYSKAGHGAAYDPINELKKIGIDCSGFVSRVLHAGGVNLPISNTATLSQYLRPGAGKDVTVFDRNTGPWADQHTLIRIMGKYFESGGNPKYNPSGSVTELTAKQAAGELAGGGFHAFHPVLSGKLATTAQLKALGLSGLSSSTGAGVNLANLIDQAKQAIAKAADSLLQRLNDAVQNGTSRTLENALGISTSGTVKVGRDKGAFSTVAKRIVEHLGGSASIGQIGKATGGLVAQGMAGTTQEKAFQQQVLALIQSGQRRLAEQLVAAHKAAEAALGQTMYAEQKTHDAQVLDNQSTALKDQTTLIQDQVQAATQHYQDERTLMQDQTNATIQHMTDMQQIVDDKMSAMVSAMQAAAQVATDRGQGVIDAINDQTQTQVDQIGERGLYGLKLVTQQLRVSADEVKAFWDQKLNQDQVNLDLAKQQADAAESSAKLNVDQVTAQQNLLVAAAQQRFDTVTMTENAKMSAAKAHVDAAQLHLDVTKIGPAQMALDMHATSSKAIQGVYQAQLTGATAGAANKLADLNKWLAGVDFSATGKINTAGLNLQGVQDTAALTEQGAKATLANITDYYNGLIQGYSNQLSSDQTAGGIAEAGATRAVNITGARASTEFAGGGININIYGTDTNNATAVADALSWTARTALA